MRLAIYSDLHLEFGDFDLPEYPEDKDTVLILAGDIGLVDKAYTFRLFVEDMASQFKEVIYILGNHEYYRYSFIKAFNTLDNAFAKYDNVSILDNDTIIIDDVAFVCSTLWTSFDNANPVAMNAAKMSMNDYQLIRTGPPDTPYLRKLDPIDTYRAHQKAVRYIFPAIAEQKEQGRKVVVVTHHLPSYLSVDKQYKGDILNSAYATELFENIMETQPDLWIHGHTHSSSDYTIGETRVLCNPRGYAGMDTNPKFYLGLRVDI